MPAKLTYLCLFRGGDHLNDQLSQNDVTPVLPTPMRVGADERFAGRGVTIAFLDSGFYPHPDLIRPENRILCYTSTTPREEFEDSFRTPDPASWHGTMTSVVAAGNGYKRPQSIRRFFHFGGMGILTLLFVNRRRLSIES